MNIISQSLRNQKSRCSLIPFITAGYPDINTTIKVMFELDSQGADVIELGIPYSDALADGPVIQNASLIAIKQKVYIDQVLLILKSVYKQISTPIIIFTYYNPLLKRGISKFIKEIALLGVKGLIIPDLPLEEADNMIIICEQEGIELILFVAPTSSLQRTRLISQKSPGCIYLVSSTGVTGIRSSIDSNMIGLAKYIKQISNKLVMLGFGISSSSQVKDIAQWEIDGIVVGTAFINRLSKPSLSERLNEISSFCKSLRDAIDN